MSLTQAELAAYLHKEPLTIGRWERGEGAIEPNAEALIRLLAVHKLGLDLNLTIENVMERCISTATRQTIRIDGANPQDYRPLMAA
jgi:transcriptional regulator with XRE-family HTH domain